AEVGHCVHRIAMHRSRPNVLFMQKHWDVMRSDDAGDSWQEISGNLPTDFGFVVDVHAHEPNTVYVVPIKSDAEHFPVDGKLRVYRSRTGGNEWEALTKGLPQSDCYVNVMRDAMAVDSLDKCGIYFGTTGGQVYGSADAGDSWAPIVRDLPAVGSVEVQTFPRPANLSRHICANSRKSTARSTSTSTVQSRKVRCLTRSRPAIRCFAGRSVTTSRTGAARLSDSLPAARTSPTNHPIHRCRMQWPRAHRPLWSWEPSPAARSFCSIRLQNKPNQRRVYEIRRWICSARPEEETGSLSAHGTEGGQGLARPRRARVHRVHRRRRQAGQAHVFPAERQTQAWRDGGVRLYRVQVARRPRSHQCQSDERPAPGRHDGP